MKNKNEFVEGYHEAIENVERYLKDNGDKDAWARLFVRLTTNKINRAPLSKEKKPHEAR